MADFDVSALVQGTGLPGSGLLHARALAFLAVAPDLAGPVIPKGRLGHHDQAISRNGRVLILSDTAMSEFPGLLSLCTLQTWRKTILPGSSPEVWGVILRVLTRFSQTLPDYPRMERTAVTRAHDPHAWLSLDLGARAFLVFYFGF